uniref:Glutamate decarboxylase 1b n=1 Tax=Monopterus albus TaxID=43700 RepID=A0A3Q3KBZ5_MONAL
WCCIKNCHSSKSDISTRAQDDFGTPMSGTTTCSYIHKCCLKLYCAKTKSTVSRSSGLRGIWDGPSHSGNVYCDLLPTSASEEMTKGFLQELVNILLAYICKSSQRSSKVLDFHHPHQLKEGLEGFSLDLPDQPETLEQILVDCRDTLKYGVSTGHPRFFNQLSSGLDVIGIAGEWLTSTANTNM